MSSGTAFPDAALEWLAPPRVDDARILLLGRPTAALAGRLSDAGADLAVTDPQPTAVQALLKQAPGALPAVADPAQLPYIPCAFDAVVAHQSLHTVDIAPVLAEFARVLAPGGRVALSWTVRDDSVPWVRRLAALMRAVDPEAMTGDYGADTGAALEESRFFTEVETRRVRLWVPISRIDLLDMVARRFPDLEPDRRRDLLTRVGELYESSAKAPTPLLLPYQVVCWRARVDHTEFTSALDLPDLGLPISL
ncbi:MAG: class I SAM-dependent methyltransferase [Propioniciclava sp.]